MYKRLRGRADTVIVPYQGHINCDELIRIENSAAWTTLRYWRAKPNVIVSQGVLSTALLMILRMLPPQAVLASILDRASNPRCHPLACIITRPVDCIRALSEGSAICCVQGPECESALRTLRGLPIGGMGEDEHALQVNEIPVCSNSDIVDYYPSLRVSAESLFIFSNN